MPPSAIGKLTVPEVSIIVPTYREAENLGVLIPRISEALAATDISAEILVVDDNSPDGTPEVCRNLAERYPLRLIVRTTERGLSSAVLAGMQAAQGDLLLVMDADLSHPPEKIAELVQALRNPATDFVIGSRYVTGGSTAGDWGLFRWINSKGATLLAWPLTSTHDPMAGFFALRRQAYLQAVERLDPIGYKIGLELLVKCGCRNVVEVPITFQDRLHGESKLTLKEQLNYLRHLRRLYNYRFGIWAYLVQFICVGATGMVIDLSAYALLLWFLPMPEASRLPVARALAIWVAMTWNYWLNRTVTFSFAKSEVWWRQYLAFCGSCLIGALVNWGASVWLTHSFPFFSAHKLTAAAVGVVAGTLFNFTLCRVVVFQKKT